MGPSVRNALLWGRGGWLGSTSARIHRESMTRRRGSRRKRRRKMKRRRNMVRKKLETTHQMLQRSAILVGVVMNDLSQIMTVERVAKLWLISVRRLRFIGRSTLPTESASSVGFVQSCAVTGSVWACPVQSLASRLLAQETGW